MPGAEAFQPLSSLRRKDLGRSPAAPLPFSIRGDPRSPWGLPSSPLPTPRSTQGGAGSTQGAGIPGMWPAWGTAWVGLLRQPWEEVSIHNLGASALLWGIWAGSGPLVLCR